MEKYTLCSPEESETNHENYTLPVGKFTPSLVGSLSVVVMRGASVVFAMSAVEYIAVVKLWSKRTQMAATHMLV